MAEQPFDKLRVTTKLSLTELKLKKFKLLKGSMDLYRS